VSREGRQHRKRHAIEKYKRKVGRESAGFMYNRFDPNLNLSIPTFAFNLGTLVGIDIDIGVTFPTPRKARYGEAQYSLDLYDPIAPLGILIPDEITKQLYIHMIRHFMSATWRGYKYSMRVANMYLYASLPIFTEFAPEPVWGVRFRKIEAWRLWTSFYNLAFYGCNIYPTEEVFIRVTDNPSFYGYPVNPRTTRNDNLSSNLYDHAVYDRAFYSREVAPYPEILLLAPNLYCYEPVYNVANYNYDVYLDLPVFDSNVLIEIMEHFKQTQQPLFRELVWFTAGEKMKLNYAIHATYQHETLQRILNRFKDVLQSPLQIGWIQAFAMEYAYERKLMRLVEAEKVIQKYIRLGLSEPLLRQAAQMTQRK
jgi:hypothetical protein